MSWPSDLRRTWLQGVFASCTLSNDLHAGHVRKFASTSSKPRSTSPNRSPSRSCTRRAVRGSVGVAPSTSLARTCGTHGLLPIGRCRHVDGHVFVEVAHRAAADVDVGAAPLHDASTPRLCEVSDDEIQRNHRITLNQQHSLTFSLAHHLIHDPRVRALRCLQRTYARELSPLCFSPSTLLPCSFLCDSNSLPLFFRLRSHSYSPSFLH